MPKIYLAGPISGLSYQACTEWRERFASLLNHRPVMCLSPLRGKEYLRQKEVIHHDHPEHVLSTQRAIMTRDFNDCTRCDLVLVNFLGVKSVSIGTCMEMAWAYQNHTPVICVMEAGNPHDHPMIREAIGFSVATIEAAAETAELVLFP